MTGYAVAAADSPRGRLSLELRSVNARFLDLQFRVAEELRALEPMLREMITARIARGKIDCRFFLNDTGFADKPQRLNTQALARLKSLAEDARRSFPDATPLGIAEVLRWPGIIAEEPVAEEAMRAVAADLCRRALEDMVATRSREGAKLAANVLERVVEMRRRVEEAGPLVPQAVAAYQAKIAERLRDAIGSADDERIRAEIAVFGSKVDVDEELDRLRAHLSEVERALRKGGAAGKRLDFLAQELNREANTLASKSASAQLSECALELKLLVEQVREQVQNIE